MEAISQRAMAEQLLWVDPQRAEVVSLDVRPTGLNVLAVDGSENILLSSLRQIGDVVLVHDESALDDEVADDSLGFVKLTGSVIETYEGRVLGKVRDYSFNPDNGRIDALKYDAWGIPSISEYLVTVWRVELRDVYNIVPGRIVLQRGADNLPVMVGDGMIDAAFNALAGVFRTTRDYADDYDPEYAQWLIDHGPAYREFYGVDPPARRDGMQAAGRPPPPRALPAPRQPAFADSLQPEQRRYREPVLARQRDPRTRRAEAEPLPQPSGRPMYSQESSRAGFPEQRDGYSASRRTGAPPVRQPQRRNEGVASTSASVPILDTRPPPYKRRDVDGRFGERPAASQASQTASSPSRMAFDDWAGQAPSARPMMAEEAGPRAVQTSSWDGTESASFDGSQAAADSKEML
ncbi:hypothetical protein WJX72_010396 [[Myrmecia] bisecta]|uniref:PRC-barrel domain-containing protein n=1 Tax=[Myrmecia] bisecta TaxID=41462 RepID=A0AAW1Q7R8_9CHLO